MKKRLLTAIMISIAMLMLTLSVSAAGFQTGADVSSKGAGATQSVLDSAYMDFQRVIETLKGNIAGVRSQKADPALLNGILVDCYDSSKPINEVAVISVQNSNTLVIDPYDLNTLGSIREAILASGIGITPENDGKCLRLEFPQLTLESRQKLIKESSGCGEQAKARIRNIRKIKLDEIREMFRSRDITENERSKAEEKLHELVDKSNGQVDYVLNQKMNEIYK